MDVPTDDTTLGPTARSTQPVIRGYIFIGRTDTTDAGDAFERKLFVIRRLVEKAVSRSATPGRGSFISSLSHRTLVYKGMLNAVQSGVLPGPEDEGFRSSLAMVHSRFSTNTFPSRSRAHPNRHLSQRAIRN